MGEELMLFTDEQLDFGAQKLDDITFKKGIPDVIDKPVYRLSLGLLNKTVSKYVPDEFIPDIQDAVTLLLAGDYDDAGAEALDVVKLAVNKIEMKQSVKDIIISLTTIIQAAIAGLD